jgi:alpha-L-fucosidase 2
MNEWLDAYNVVWDSPSKDALGSMPIGNGDFGANVWVEESGDILLLLGKTDAWDENSVNLKLGRIRLKIFPAIAMAGAHFRQRLTLRTADIDLTIGPLSLKIWTAANHPIIHIDAAAQQAFEIEATVEIWRTNEAPVKTQTGDLFRDLSGKDPYPTIISPDTVLPAGADRIAWCHHNAPRNLDGYEINLKLQGLGEYLDRTAHPLLGRTFGASLFGNDFLAAGDRAIKSARPAKVHRVMVSALTRHPSTIEQWHADMNEQVHSLLTIHPHHERQEHTRWWDEFWSRSWLVIPSAPDVTRGYILQRYMNACAGRGEQPIKFNGSIFTVGKPEDPDFRRWGGPGFWFQNTRLIYWPMRAAGDFDLMQPFFRMYREMLPLQKHRTKTYYGHGGAHYPETITFWGAEVSAHYGWTPFEQRKQPEAECSYVTYYWTCGIELSLMACEYFAMTLDEEFARETLLPIADAVMEFFDLHYPRDASGKIRIEPSQAMETWHIAGNPLPDIAGLRYTLPKLLELPENLTTEVQRGRWTRMLGELPPLPIGEKDGATVLLPAEKFDKKKNTENPELYAVFPFRIFGVGKPDLDLARRTFAARLHQSHDCWSQDDIQMAMLGLAEQAKDFVSRRASPASHSDSRFPAFWNAFHDWIPDMDHGGVLQMALQSMLMQCEGSEIRLLPAWPREWDSEFKLHAPQQTIVEGKVRGGKIVDLTVTPKERRRDIVVM